MNAFAAAIEVLFADPHLSRTVMRVPAGGGAAHAVRAILRAPDAIADFGGGRIWSDTLRLDLRVADVPSPAPGDTITIDGADYKIQGEPVRDRERLVWSVDLRPA